MSNIADAQVASPPTPGIDSKERFFRYFQHEVAALKQRMDQLADTSPIGGERSYAIEHCLAGIERLSHAVKDVSSYIPAYDQRTYGEALKALSEKLQNIRNSFAPPKKFQFKSARKSPTQSVPEITKTSPKSPLSPVRSTSRSPTSPFSLAKPSSLTPLEEKTEDAVQPNLDSVDGEKTDGHKADGVSDGADGVDCVNGGKPDGVDGIRTDGTTNASHSHMSSTSSRAIAISSKSDVHIILGSSAAHSSNSGTVSNISSSVIDMSQLTVAGKPLAGLHLKNIKDSLVICGQVSGPVHITDVQNSVLVTACRQFRMHGSKNTRVYLHCSSRPIIEDCEEIQFAALPEVYTTRELRKTTNNWDQIDDFKWLKAEPSPHFRLLDSQELMPSQTWIDIAPGGSKKSVKGVLEAVRVLKR